MLLLCVVHLQQEMADRLEGPRTVVSNGRIRNTTHSDAVNLLATKLPASMRRGKQAFCKLLRQCNNDYILIAFCLHNAPSLRLSVDIWIHLEKIRCSMLTVCSLIISNGFLSPLQTVC